MLETLPLPSISALRKLRKGNIDYMKAVKLLLETGQISKDIIMMVDEMYLQKCIQYIGGDLNNNPFYEVFYFYHRAISAL